MANGSRSRVAGSGPDMAPEARGQGAWRRVGEEAQVDQPGFPPAPRELDPRESYWWPMTHFWKFDL